MTMQGAPVWSRNLGSHRRVASCIKMLTALVVREHTNLDDVVVVPRQAEAINDGDVGLVKGQRLTVRQLLQIMLIPSANDAAMALAIHVGGTEAAFVDMMNAKAKALGLKHTRAADPDGLNKKEICTAEDLTVLARDVMADPVLRQIVGMRSVVVPHPRKKSTVHASTNLLLGHYTGMEGTKTGFTNPAGYCFVGSARRGGVELLGVVLGATSNAGRFSEMRKLLDWGFAHTHVRLLISVDTTLGMVPVVNGVETSVAVCTTHSVSAAVYDSGSAVTTSLTVPASVLATVSAEQPLGVVAAYKDGAMVATAAVVAARDVPAISVPVTSAVPAQVGAGALRAIWEPEAAGTLGVWTTWLFR
jgi:D-alanyl-D-alanine carboxypeptidase (penicillin-binding protein 5/6)